MAREASSAARAETGGTEVLSASGVWFGYASQTVLEDVNLELRSGEFVALVGPNGSGKTTLLRILLGLLRPDRGTVRLFGEDPARLTEPWRLGYVPQRPGLRRDLPATVEEVVASGRLVRTGWWRWPKRADRKAIAHAIESVGLGPLRAHRITELSGGQQQRALIARAFAGEPDLLVLDEPVAGVDGESQRLFRESVTHLVEQHRGTVLLVSHELGAVASDLDRIVVLKRKVLFDGTTEDLAATGVSLGVHREDLPLWLEELV